MKNTSKSSTSSLVRKYIWIIDTIYNSRRKDGITFKEIAEKWQIEKIDDGNELPLRTFHNHITAIENIFDINIVCERKGGYLYHIESEEDLQSAMARSWTLNALAINNIIKESDDIKNRVLFEYIPSGREFLNSLITAMKQNRKVHIVYHSYNSADAFEYDIEPYCLKIFKQRWYVVAKAKRTFAAPDAQEHIRIFSLDRIQFLMITENDFVYPDDFDPEKYFKYSFGIFVEDNIKEQTILIKVIGSQRNYIKALPLHWSQEEIEKKDTYSIFRFQLVPTFDFRQEILSHANFMEVLKPKSFRDDIAQCIKTMNDIYNEKKEDNE